MAQHHHGYYISLMGTHIDGLQFHFRTVFNQVSSNIDVLLVLQNSQVSASLENLHGENLPALPGSVWHTGLLWPNHLNPEGSIWSP